MDERAALNELVAAWRGVSLEREPYVMEGDDRALADSDRITYGSYEEYIDKGLALASHFKVE